ncbi:MAG: hypothetical protein CMK03_06650 [Ponticaulis sp.]|nr:hypothetical protein [Ponticaulis sp.]|tara:strand:+ start:82 stop:495 length:414 start_codon:yes stop_codon:yes gene_type:complete
MKVDIGELEYMARSELVERYVSVLGTEPPKRIGSKTLARIIAWEEQAKKFGGLKKSVRSELAKVVAEQKIRPSEIRARSGTRLVREWNGVKHVVDVDDDGIRYLGKTYKSLTSVAQKITGAHWSGPRFFGLKPKRSS